LDPRWRETFAAWAETEGHRERVAAASARIREHLGTHQSYCSFSGGKDSTAMLSLVLQAAPGTLVYHWDFGPDYVPRGLEAEVAANARAIGARAYEVATSPRYGHTHEGPVWYRAHFGREEPRLLALGYTGVFVGIRAEESRKRARRIATGESLGRIAECWPVRDWTWMDVWALIVSRALPYPAVYDERAALVGWDKARFATFFDPEFARLGAEPVDNVLHWRLRGG
jgi:3'-phosphoadenosine 5'-phosphosulfate sulfotransferase (PAPS reductase)/FAD synthetase